MITSSGTPLWEDGTWAPGDPLVGEVTCDVCVVGLGGSGLAAIDELLAMGLRVVGLEAQVVAAGAAGRNGGFLRAGLAAFHHEAVGRYGRERAARLYRLTMAERDRMVRDMPEVVRRIGYLRLAYDAEEERDCRAQLEAMLADDLPATWYDGAVGRGVLVRDDAVCNPLARCRRLARHVVARGARLYERTAAVAVAGDLVETTDGRVRCGAVIVAVDGGLARLLPELGDRVRSVRLQMLGTAPVPVRAMTHAIGCRWGWDYWQQTPEGHIAFGGCRDVGGAAEWTDDTEPSAVVQAALEQRLRDHLAVTAPVTHRWAASVGYTDDGLPRLDEVRPRVWAVGAYSGTGNLLGAVCARAAAHLATGRTHESPLRGA